MDCDVHYRSQTRGILFGVHCNWFLGRFSFRFIFISDVLIGEPRSSGLTIGRVALIKVNTMIGESRALLVYALLAIACALRAFPCPHR